MDPGKSPTLTLEHIGHERAWVLVIDDFHPDPRALVDEAAARTDYAATSSYYPGVRSRGTFEYVRLVRERLRYLAPQLFGAPKDVIPTECNFSMVTRRAEDTIPFQRIPHFDGTDPRQIAVLHYLCEPRHGGTSFYRHRPTGYEVINAHNVDSYRHAVEDDVRRTGMPAPGYVNGSTGLFERIASFEAAFNRALVYRGNSLHSGSIPADFVPDANPRTGRLTLNTFLQLQEAD